MERTRSQIAWHIILLGLTTGMAGDFLFHNTRGLGINALLWTIVVVVAAGRVSKERTAPLAAHHRLLAATLILCGALVVVRDTETLHGYETFATLLVVSIATSYYRAESIGQLGLLDYIRACGLTGLMAAIFPGKVFQELDTTNLKATGANRQVTAAVRGVLIAIPLLVVFSLLFTSADPIFEHYFRKAFNWDVSNVINHVAAVVVISWATIGCFRYAILETESPGALPSPPAFLGRIEIGTVLGLLNALFTAFVFVQIHYLFGGKAHIAATVHLTYAEYARKGFFELVWAIALSLPVLLLLHQFTDKTERAADWTFRIASTLYVALLAVIMASAVLRMQLYVGEYGLTELRLYTTAAMAWFGLVFAWFTITILLGKRERFAIGAFVSGIATLAGTVALNPDALIARTNVALAARTNRFDACYATSLSADAVPGLIASLPAIPADKQPVVAYMLLKRWSPAPADWRTWNLGRIQAWNTVQRNIFGLRQAAAPVTTDPCERQDETY